MIAVTGRQGHTWLDRATVEIRMKDFTISRCSRKCAREDRSLDPGERFVSVIERRGGGLQRSDISESAWQSPPERCVAWWRGRMPTADQAKRVPAPVDVLLQTLGELCECPDDQQVAYLLGVLLLRRRVLEVVDSANEINPATDDQPHAWILRGVTDQTLYHLTNFDASADRLTEHQDRLVELLFVET